ncbi:hypothetical protein HMPREF3205_00824 [Streptococcus pasteurianus]|nr:hypothetical protein HMPREF3205_00824 [Streptococcus pasteurianus]
MGVPLSTPVLLLKFGRKKNNKYLNTCDTYDVIILSGGKSAMPMTPKRNG